MKHYWLPTACAVAVLVLNAVQIWRFEVGYRNGLIEEDRQLLVESERRTQQSYKDLAERGDEARSPVFIWQRPDRLAGHLNDSAWRDQRVDSLLNPKLCLAIGATAVAVWLAATGLVWLANRAIENPTLTIWLGLAVGLCVVIVLIRDSVCGWLPAIEPTGSLSSPPTNRLTMCQSYLLHAVTALVVPVLFSFLAARHTHKSAILTGVLTAAVAALVVFIGLYGMAIGDYWRWHLHLLFGMGCIVLPDPYAVHDPTVMAATAILLAAALGSLGGGLAVLERKLREGRGSG